MASLWNINQTDTQSYLSKDVSDLIIFQYSFFFCSKLKAKTHGESL
jgi:hypothetical protein